MVVGRKKSTYLVSIFSGLFPVSLFLLISGNRRERHLGFLLFPSLHHAIHKPFPCADSPFSLFSFLGSSPDRPRKRLYKLIDIPQRNVLLFRSYSTYPFSSGLAF